MLNHLSTLHLVAVMIIATQAAHASADLRDVWISDVQKDDHGVKRFCTLSYDGDTANLLIFRNDTKELQERVSDYTEGTEHLIDGWVLERQKIERSGDFSDLQLELDKDQIPESVSAYGVRFSLCRMDSMKRPLVHAQEAERFPATPLGDNVPTRWVTATSVSEMENLNQPAYSISRMSFTHDDRFIERLYRPFYDREFNLAGYALLGRRKGLVKASEGVLVIQSTEVMMSPGQGFKEVDVEPRERRLHFDPKTNNLVVLKALDDGAFEYVRWCAPPLPPPGRDKNTGRSAPREPRDER